MNQIKARLRLGFFYWGINMKLLGSEGRGELITAEGEKLPVSFQSKTVSSVPINHEETKAEQYLKDIRDWLGKEFPHFSKVGRYRSKHKFRKVDGICKYCGMSRAEHEFSHREAPCVTKRRTKED